MSSPSERAGEPRIGICAIAKNEGAYLAEWVAYHSLIGFNPIRVYVHDSTDESLAVLDRLGTFGLAEGVPFTAPDNKKPQWLAYQAGLANLRERTEWIAFIDLDEFIVMPRYATIQELVADYEHLDAIAMNWKMFGSSGHERHEPGLVMERFKRCAPWDFRGNRALKTLARGSVIETPLVHMCLFKEGVEYQTVLGEVIPPHEGKSQQITHDVIRVNHYFTRSREEWDAKAKRGRGAKPVNSPVKHRTIQEFEAHDRNEEIDTEILRFADPVKRRIAHLGLDHVVRGVG